MGRLGVSVVFVAALGCSSRDENARQRDVSKADNSDLVSARAIAILKWRKEYDTRRFDKALRESVVYLCNASGALATNIRESKLEEILVPDLAPDTIGLGCGTQTLVDARIVHGTYLQFGVWTGPDFAPGRLPDDFNQDRLKQPAVFPPD